MGIILLTVLFIFGVAFTLGGIVSLLTGETTILFAPMFPSMESKYQTKISI